MERKPASKGEVFHVFLDDLLVALEHFKLAYDSTAGSKPLSPAIPLLDYFRADEYAETNPDEMEALWQCCDALDLNPEDLTVQKLFEWHKTEVNKQ